MANIINFQIYLAEVNILPCLALLGFGGLEFGMIMDLLLLLFCFAFACLGRNWLLGFLTGMLIWSCSSRLSSDNASASKAPALLGAEGSAVVGVVRLTLKLCTPN